MGKVSARQVQSYKNEVCLSVRRQVSNQELVGILLVNLQIWSRHVTGIGTCLVYNVSQIKKKGNIPGVYIIRKCTALSNS